MQLYNSLSKKKELFKPLKPEVVSIYSCGPTVYDHAHIGNMRAYITADVLVRTLKHIGKAEVTWVMNITDIDDRIIDRLKRDYPNDDPNTARQKLTDKFTKIFYNDLVKVNVDKNAIEFVRATDYISKMQSLISQLVGKGLAYESAGSVYFSLDEYRKKGHKYGLLINIDYEAQARVTDDQDQKDGAADFVLWKAAHEGEPSWDFELNGKQLPGRPGWHIECTAMSTEKLGHVFDIHTGGVDLKFPHHENEIAQNEGKLANYFIHNEHLLVENRKMSKSANNFYTLNEIDDPLAFRYLVLQAHYRKQMDYSNEALQSAHDRLVNLRQYADQMVLKKPGSLAKKDSSGITNQFIKKFNDALIDDLNTAEALATLSLIEGKIYTQETLEALSQADKVLALNLIDTSKPSADIYSMIDEYEQARASKNYEVSDKLRAQLHNKGYFVSDTNEGTLVSQKR